jgi:uncharacterized protein (TIGR02646 family)
MIRIKRPKEVPPHLQSKTVKDARLKIKNIVDEEKRKPLSDEFPRHWGKSEVREALWTMQHKKCAYCERLRDVNRESDIEHFRPKAEVTLPEKAPPHNGYWWLAYEWSNLLFSCKYCNAEHKLNSFPVPDEAKRVRESGQPLNQERAYLLDPSDDADDPENCFTYYVNPTTKKVWPRPRPEDPWNEERAKQTIRILGLDRDELCEERGKCVKTLSLLVIKMNAARQLGPAAEGMKREAAAEIREETRSSQAFAGFRREYFRARELGEYVSQE